MRRIIEAIVVATLTLSGVLGVLVSVADLAGIDVGGLITKEPASITLLLLGLISIAIGLERATTGRKHAATLASVDEFLTTAAGVRRIEGRPAIYRHGAYLVGLAENRIRSVVAGYPVKAPKEFATAVISRLRELDRQGRPARFDVVIIADFANSPPSWRQDVLARRQYYEANGVGHLVAVHILDQENPLTMDCLIIDRTHASLAFSPTAGTEKLVTGLFFDDEPEIANQMAEWFDQRVLAAAKLVT